MRHGTSAQALREFTPRLFRPAWWLPGAHAQTIAGRVLRRPHPPVFRRERIETPDGDFLDLDWVPAQNREAPLVLLLHGLEGSARRGYAINTYSALAANGLRAVGLNFRSCGGEPNLTARFYHSGETGDLRVAIDLLEQRFGQHVAAAIGFSLGGNVLLKYLAEEGADARLGAAVAVSVPYDLAAGADALDATPMGRLYTSHFLASLVEKMESKSALLGSHIDLERIRRARSFREFDDAATAPLHGFAGAEDYYSRSSSGPLLDRIRVATLLIHAADDPFLPPSAIPHGAIDRNDCLRVVLTRRGGHVGFIAGSLLRPAFWAEAEAARFLGQALGTRALSNV
jgi:predicted alpha/beta-fold hydrolase